MQQATILNRTRPLSHSLTVDYCDRFLCKLRGLMLRKSLRADRGLLLADKTESRLGAGIHMLGMRFDICAVWLDAKLKVVDVRRARRCRSYILPRSPARYVIECSVLRYEDFAIGDQLAFQTSPA